jgi:hypothetical protein
VGKANGTLSGIPIGSWDEMFLDFSDFAFRYVMANAFLGTIARRSPEALEHQLTEWVAASFCKGTRFDFACCMERRTIPRIWKIFQPTRIFRSVTGAWMHLD